ncbi:MMPL family transporter [Sulfurovum sp. zt1-1]|uniref:MMPL family transporter n=1 Tax=Sulfurovum zhangzhouensis TaxID=3019067 RepID=A0ABT7QX38_9BACT|nr:MMPL family transporter [Sulfurovum zhangzhouensis]MDM5271390.1 MMPL family transporter [Sulfurovum zhangzhouensis]
MGTYINFLDKYKYILIVLITIVVGIFSLFLKDLSFEGSYRIWFDKDSKIIKNYDLFRTTFSGDDTFIVAFKDQNGIFNPKAVQIILELTQEFKKIDGVQKVDSLTNYQYISAIDDDLMIEDFIYDLNVDLKEKKELALQDRLILNQLISEDGKTTMLAVRLSSNIGTNEEVNIAVFKKLLEITNQYSSMSGYNFYISGTPAVTASLVTISQGDAKILMPLAIIIVVLLLFFIFRNFVGIFVPTLIVLFTFLIVLSIQVIAGYKLNNFTVNIPSFISAIAIAGCMHLFLSWAYYKEKVKTNKEAVYRAMKSNIIPIALTSLTTAIGFASLGISEIEPISTLGLAITSGATWAFVFTITIAPAILLTLKDDYRFQLPRFLNLLNTQGYGAFITKNNKKIVFGFIFFSLIISYGLKDIKVDSNSIKYFSEDTVVRSGSDFVEKNLTGSMVYEIILDSKQKEGVKKPEFLYKIVQFEKEFKAKFENVRFTTSLKDIIIRMQKVLNPVSSDTIPKTQNLVAQYLLLYSMSLPQGMEINDKIDTSEQYLRFSINSNIVDTSKDLEMISWIKEWWKNNSNYSADVQGQTAIFAYMQSSITDTLIISISSTLMIVTLIMFLIFRNLKILWLFIVPNIAPVILVAGIMGYLGITIDIGIAISAAVILGIAVDDTVHFFSKFFDAIKTKSFEESIDYVISHSGNAMILTTFILSSTFSLFAVSDFIPNVNFAIVTVCALNVALLLDLVLLPALLSLFYKGKTYAS